ncbi:MAG: hypothetical protein CMO55_29025 [Verrucomicrobiales bacterium]|nr:hypothetical protein [Verrucomicrobiales bacterium]
MNRVPTSCLDRLNQRDFLFIEELILGSPPPGNGLQSLFEERDSLLAILEHDKLFQALIELPYPLGVSPELYFFVMVRRGLKNGGIDDVEVADYVSAVLASHAMGGSGGLADLESPGVDFSYHVDFLYALEGLSDYDRFFLEVECGNHFLVLTGLFPKFLEHRASRRGAPGLGYYEDLARGAFLSAGDHPLADEFAVRSVYPRLADCFSETRRALNLMAQEYLFLGS